MARPHGGSDNIESEAVLKATLSKLCEGEGEGEEGGGFLTRPAFPGLMRGGQGLCSRQQQQAWVATNQPHSLARFIPLHGNRPESVR
jgi:hypothetical protein